MAVTPASNTDAATSDDAAVKVDLKAGTKRKASESVAAPVGGLHAEVLHAEVLHAEVSADAGSTATPRPRNAYDEVKWCTVRNDGRPESLTKLIGLKSLFAKQLPKMPKEYIVRLVLDRRHKSLAILSQDPKHKGGDEEIIGGICYRAYPEMRFAEIAFCAVSASQQVKGYGTKLMNLLKRQAVLEGLEYFITYADNYAVGYFKKQGFTKVSFISIFYLAFLGCIPRFISALKSRIIPSAKLILLCFIIDPPIRISPCPRGGTTVSSRTTTAARSWSATSTPLSTSLGCKR